MKKIFSLPVIAILACSILLFQACQTAKSSSASRMLKFGFEKGKGYDYEMISNIDQEINGQKMKMDMAVYYSMDVAEDNGETKTINSSFDRFKMDMAVGGMSLKVDTENPLPESGSENDPMALFNRMMSSIKGKKFTMKVDAEGRITEVTGFEDMATDIVATLPGDEQTKEEVAAQFKEQFNEKSIKEQMERVWYLFPNKEVKVGDSWQKTSLTGGPMGQTYESTYTVKEIEGDMVTLGEKTTIKQSMEGADISGTITGESIIDSKSGLIVKGDQDLKMTTTVQGTTFTTTGKIKILGKAR